MITLATRQEHEERTAANSPDYLLDLSRNCGLREAMHGVPPAKARELLSAFVGLLDAEREAAHVPEGYVLAPIEPSAELLYQWQDVHHILPPRGRRMWRTALNVIAAEPIAADEPMTEPFMVTGTGQRKPILEATAALRCAAAPAGWGCTRDAGHDGPCAALPIEPKRPFSERALSRIASAIKGVRS